MKQKEGEYTTSSFMICTPVNMFRVIHLRRMACIDCRRHIQTYITVVGKLGGNSTLEIHGHR
jgi:hypothetical protein